MVLEGKKCEQIWDYLASMMSGTWWWSNGGWNGMRCQSFTHVLYSLWWIIVSVSSKNYRYVKECLGNQHGVRRAPISNLCMSVVKSLGDEVGLQQRQEKEGRRTAGSI